MTKQPKYKQYFLCRLFFCPLRRNFRRKLDSLCRRWQQLHKMDDNEDRLWMTTKIRHGWQQRYNLGEALRMAKKTCDPANFFVATTINAEAKWSWIAAAAPKKVPKNSEIHGRWQSTCRPRGATPRAARRSLSPRRTPPRGRPPTMCSWPRGITNYWRCPVSSLDKNGIDSEIYLQGPCVRGLPLPLAVWWLWSWWSSSASSPGQPRPGREYF